MTDEVGPEDFTGDLEKGETAETQDSGGLGSRLKYGASAATGAVAGLYTRPRDAVYNLAGARDSETGEVDEDRRNALRAAGGVLGLLAAGAAADKYSDGELDGNIEGVGGFGGPVPAGNETNGTPTETEPADEYTETGTDEPPADTDTPTETDTPTDTETPQDTDTPTETESPTDTATETEQPYSGQIDGSQYELQPVPGPVEGEGYMVEDEILADYDSDGWEDIIDEEEYEELGTAADWYVQQDALIGVNEPEQISRTFPGEEFGYDTQALYEDIREEAGN